ncbi:VTT domain-containing protein [Peptococcaceae bacterium]|nr:VTT domain-containing protein [Peptococcaceae bacterium]
MDQLVEIFQEYGSIGLFIIAFLDSFLPMPTELLFIPLGLANPEMLLWYVFLTAIASSMGAPVGYLLGLKGGRPVLKRMFKAKDIGKVENLFAKHGTVAIIIAGFSPFPYQVATVASGAFRISLKKLMFWTFISRGARFCLFAVIIVVFGEEAREFLISPEFVYLVIIITTVGLLLYGLYWVVKIRK